MIQGSMQEFFCCLYWYCDWCGDVDFSADGPSRTYRPRHQSIDCFKLLSVASRPPSLLQTFPSDGLIYTTTKILRRTIVVGIVPSASKAIPSFWMRIGHCYRSPPLRMTCQSNLSPPHFHWLPPTVVVFSIERMAKAWEGLPGLVLPIPALFPLLTLVHIPAELKARSNLFIWKIWQ